MKNIEINQMIKNTTIKLLFIPLNNTTNELLSHQNCREELSKIFGQWPHNQIVYTIKQKEFRIKAWKGNHLEQSRNVLSFACKGKDIVVVAKFEGQSMIVKKQSKTIIEKSQNRTDFIKNMSLPIKPTNPQHKQNIVDIKPRKSKQKNKPHSEKLTKSVGKPSKSPQSKTYIRKVYSAQEIESEISEEFNKIVSEKILKDKQQQQLTNQSIQKIIRKYNKECTIIYAYVGTSNIQLLDYDPQNNTHISEYYKNCVMTLISNKDNPKEFTSLVYNDEIPDKDKDEDDGDGDKKQNLIQKIVNDVILELGKFPQIQNKQTRLQKKVRKIKEHLVQEQKIVQTHSQHMRKIPIQPLVSEHPSSAPPLNLKRQLPTRQVKILIPAQIKREQKNIFSFFSNLCCNTNMRKIQTNDNSERTMPFIPIRK